MKIPGIVDHIMTTPVEQMDPNYYDASNTVLLAVFEWVNPADNLFTRGRVIDVRRVIDANGWSDHIKICIENKCTRGKWTV